VNAQLHPPLQRRAEPAGAALFPTRGFGPAAAPAPAAHDLARVSVRSPGVIQRQDEEDDYDSGYEGDTESAADWDHDAGLDPSTIATDEDEAEPEPVEPELDEREVALDEQAHRGLSRKARKRGKQKGSAAARARRSLGRALPGEAELQAAFHGTESTPVTEVSHEQVFGALHSARRRRGPLGRDANRLLRTLESGEPWQVTAGIHSGGLGNAAQGVHADERPHVSMQAGGKGFHLRLSRPRTGPKKKNKPQNIVQITTPGDDSYGGLRGASAYGRTDRQRPSEVQDMMDQHGLTELEALRAVGRVKSQGARPAEAAQLARALRGQKKTRGANTEAHAQLSQQERAELREWHRKRQWGPKKKKKGG
jgi:hypothetical protein